VSADTKETTKRFSALQHRDFRVLWFGMLFSSGTMAFQYYAQMWLVYDLTDSVWLMGMLGGVRGFAILLFGLYGGALADRLDRRKLLLVTQTLAFIVNLTLGFLAISGSIDFTILFLLIFIGSATASVDGPIRQALIPELVAKEHIPNAVALTTAAALGSFALTPVLAGFVIESVGSGGAYLISTLGNVGVVVALYMLHYRGQSTPANRQPVIQTIGEGIRYGRQHTVIFWVIILNFATAAFGFALYLGPIVKWAADVLLLSPFEYGLLEATWGIGTLGASLYLSYVAEIRNPGRILVVGSLVFGMSLIMFGFVRSLPLAAIAYVINGAAWTAASIASAAIIQSMVPNEVRGRIMSLFMINGAVAQMHALLLGVGADLWTIEMLLPGTAILCTSLVCALWLTIKPIRNLDKILASS
jgi:MFS family permease